MPLKLNTLSSKKRTNNCVIKEMPFRRLANIRNITNIARRKANITKEAPFRRRTNIIITIRRKASITKKLLRFRRKANIINTARLDNIKSLLYSDPKYIIIYKKEKNY